MIYCGQIGSEILSIHVYRDEMEGHVVPGSSSF
jgi:hypothetical protein